MHYVIGDIHNEAKKLRSILNQINMGPQDELIVLGDIFDRGGVQPNPVEVYFMLSEMGEKCTWIRGNHDQWLADYIDEYFSKSEKKRRKMAPYSYNSFELMNERLTEFDMITIADLIHKLPLQRELIIDDKKYLFAHAMTSHPNVPRKRGYYLMGNCLLDTFFLEGVEGYISFVGHTPTGNVASINKSLYLDEYLRSIWRNDKGNVYLMDCGCGFGSGRLACMCIETRKRFYSEAD
ncbi:MAG: metallophosphoesterase [Agathobacter sp.]|nr:metallophosphoesterase [Agathobacter sp.]